MDISKDESTKDRIINILSNNWPLTLRKIYYLLKKKGQSITYQAVHKALHQLVDEKKLRSSSEGYILNLDWIKEIHDKTEIIRVNYFSKNRSFLPANDTGKESISVFIFSTWFDVEKYLYYLQKNVLKGVSDKRSICIHHHHEWRPLFYMRAEYNWIKKLRDEGYKLYTICAGQTVLDKWSRKFYKSLGNNILIGKRLSGAAEMIVFSDLVIEVYVPFELLKHMDSYLEGVHSIDDIDPTWLIKNIFEKPCEIKVIIHKDRHLADETRKHLIAKFR